MAQLTLTYTFQCNLCGEKYAEEHVMHLHDDPRKLPAPAGWANLNKFGIGLVCHKHKIMISIDGNEQVEI